MPFAVTLPRRKNFEEPFLQNFLGAPKI